MAEVEKTPVHAIRAWGRRAVDMPEAPLCGARVLPGVTQRSAEQGRVTCPSCARVLAGNATRTGRGPSVRLSNGTVITRK